MTTKAGSGKGPEVKFRYSMITVQGVGTGKFYTQGHYDYAITDSNLTQASPAQTHGATNEPSGVHASIIAGGAGSASGGAGPVEIEVSGASINELGVRVASDTEILVADITTMALNQYFETTKKWLGVVTYTLKNASGSTQTTFNANFNYGHCKYTDRSDRNFIIKEFKAEGLAGANDAGFDIRLLKHSASGWTYSAAAFVPGNGEIIKLSTDYGPDRVLASGEWFAWDRAGLSTEIEGSGSEGYIAEMETTANNAVQYATIGVGVIFK